jgi:hypothetical protein
VGSGDVSRNAARFDAPIVASAKLRRVAPGTVQQLSTEARRRLVQRVIWAVSVVGCDLFLAVHRCETGLLDRPMDHGIIRRAQLGPGCD